MGAGSQLSARGVRQAAMQSGATRCDAHAAGSRGPQRAPVLDLSPRRDCALSATPPPLVRSRFGGPALSWDRLVYTRARTWFLASSASRKQLAAAVLLL